MVMEIPLSLYPESWQAWAAGSIYIILLVLGTWFFYRR
ncbi:hypothetical protein LCGC14_2262830, partial [marine sediment metagenome]